MPDERSRRDRARAPAGRPGPAGRVPADGGRGGRRGDQRDGPPFGAREALTRRKLSRVSDDARRPTPVLLTLSLACVAFSLSQTLVVPALPALAEEFDASASTVSWVLTGFLLSASIATPIVGKLGDLFGKGRVLTVVLVLFSVGAVINALAGSIHVVIAGRLLQGVAGGVFPLAFGIVRDTFPREHIPGGLALVSAIFGIGGGIGLPLSGVIVDNLDLQWLFWINLIALPAAFAAHRLIPPSPPVKDAKVDWIGAVALSARPRGHPARRLAGQRVGLGLARQRRHDRRRPRVPRRLRRRRGPRRAAADRPPGAAPALGRGHEPDRLHGRRGDVLELPDHAPARAVAGVDGLRVRLHRHRGRAAADADRAGAAARRRARDPHRRAGSASARCSRSARSASPSRSCSTRSPTRTRGSWSSAASCSARASRSRSRRWPT